MNKEYTGQKSAKLNKRAKESSGLETAGPTGDLWTHADGGNTARLYRVTRQGDLLQALDLEPLQNIDWEDLAQDDEHQLYVGDFGNNRTSAATCASTASAAPPGNRSIPSLLLPRPAGVSAPQGPPQLRLRGLLLLPGQPLPVHQKPRRDTLVRKQYVLPARPGRYVARLADSLPAPHLRHGRRHQPRWSPGGAIGRRLRLPVRAPARPPLFDGLKSRLRLPKAGQAEALVYINDYDFIFSNEKGTLFEARRIAPTGTAQAQ